MDVCGLTETRWRGERVKQWEYGVGICAGGGENETAREGVCIAVSKKWETNINCVGRDESKNTSMGDCVCMRQLMIGMRE